jgi:tetratricopeptide (TPR) repeat protein
LILYPFFSTSTVGQTTADDFLKSANDDRRNGQLDAVIADCDKAIELDPSNGLACLYRGHPHFTQRHWKEAIADFRKACDLSPTRFEDTRLLIWAARARMGEKRAASAELAEYFDKKVTATERSIASPIPTLAPNSFDAAAATFETGPPTQKLVIADGNGRSGYP